MIFPSGIVLSWPVDFLTYFCRKMSRTGRNGTGKKPVPQVGIINVDVFYMLSKEKSSKFQKNPGSPSF